MTEYLGPDRRRFWTVKEVADYYAVSEDAVYAAIRKGSLCAYRVGGSLRVREADAVAFGKPVGDSTSRFSVNSK